MKSRPFHCRKLQLGFGYGLVKLVAQIRFDQMNEVLELLRSLGVPHELTHLAEGARVFEKGEPVPLRRRRSSATATARACQRTDNWRPCRAEAKPGCRGCENRRCRRRRRPRRATAPRPATALRRSRSA